MRKYCPKGWTLHVGLSVSPFSLALRMVSLFPFNKSLNNWSHLFEFISKYPLSSKTQTLSFLEAVLERLSDYFNNGIDRRKWSGNNSIMFRSFFRLANSCGCSWLAFDDQTGPNEEYLRLVFIICWPFCPSQVKYGTVFSHCYQWLTRNLPLFRSGNLSWQNLVSSLSSFSVC